MTQLLKQLGISSPDFLPQDQFLRIIITLFWLLLGIILIRAFILLLRRTLKGRMPDHPRKLIQSFLFYTLLFILFLIILNYNGINLTPLLGAAGILGVAIGIASQTSLSNIISGVFLLAERPFSIGDVIKTNGTSGIVESIRLMSVTIRTFDNLYIRIPSHTVFSSELTNVSRFPIRRLDLKFWVHPREDLERLTAVLKDTAEKNTSCLMNPEPLIVFTGIEESGLGILLGVWFYKTDYLEVKNSITKQLLQNLGKEGITLSHPRRVVELNAYTSPSDSAIESSTS